VRLILDFIPNHVAPDHPWAVEHPEYFIGGDAQDLRRDPASFVEIGGKVFACGRDPYFPAWPDVLQLNAFHPGLREAAVATVNAIADQCDALRCDMSMLLLNDIFERTWGGRAGTKPTEEYWPKLVQATKRDYPDFKFIAEAYWDLEWQLQQQGFDYTYDKRLYDRLEHGEVERIRLHLLADAAYQERMVRFIENHDEPRARAVFSAGKGRAAAVAVLTLPGARLVHEGQAEGKKVRLPVFLGRRPAETSEQDLAAFYARLMDLTSRNAFRNGQWQLCERSGWPDNTTFDNLLTWCWRQDDERHLVVINFSDHPAQARVRVAWDELRGKSWRLRDGLSGGIYDRSGNEIVEQGLYVELQPWQSHVFEVSAL
jgi:glycosidase